MVTKPIEKNPFIITPGEFWADRKRLWQRLMDYIELARMTRSNEIIVLVGDYGCGTTHTLKYLEKFLKQKGAFVSYFTTPVGGDLSSLYRGFLEDIPSDRRRRIVEKLAEDLVGRPETRESLDRWSRLSSEEIEDTILSLISGSRLTLRQRRIADELGILGRLPSTTEIWSRILLDLTTKEYPVFVLMDEFDAALLNVFSAQELLFNLRRLYDETHFGMCLVIGLKGEPKDARERLGSAIYSRMSLQPIFLDPLSKDEGLDFLQDVLEHAYGERKNKFLPFTEEGVKTLVDLSCPCTPRRLLRVCSVTFEEAHREGLSRIDRDFVLKMVTKFGAISISVPLPKEEKPEIKREVAVSRPALEGVIEYDSNGSPHLLLDPAKLTAKEVIGLMMYAVDPSSLSLRELRDLVSKNWKSVSIERVSADIAKMRGLVIKEGSKGLYRYKLSGLGKSWTLNELLPTVK